MQLAISQHVPLTQWEDGTIRIAGTRVTLDVIVRQFTLVPLQNRFTTAFRRHL